MPRAKVKIQDMTIHLGDTFPLFRVFIMECEEDDEEDIGLHIQDSRKNTG